MHTRETYTASAFSERTPDDAQLLARTEQHDPSAFRALFDRYAPHARALAMAIMRHEGEADEVVLGVFTDIWRRPTAYATNGRSVRSGLMQSVQRSASKRAREARSGHARESPVPTPASDVTSVHPLADADFDGSFLGALSVEQRQIVELVYLRGLSIQEVSARLGVTPHAVMKDISDGMRSLRVQLVAREGLESRAGAASAGVGPTSGTHVRSRQRRATGAA